MPIKPYPTPEKYCLHCGVRLIRPRFKNGKLEAPTLFLRRKYCSSTCANSKHIVTKNSYHKRARKYRKEKCEACGTIKSLQAHHIDQNYKNDDQKNIQTLCKHCHDFWHKVATRLRIKIAGRMPEINSKIGQINGRT